MPIRPCSAPVGSGPTRGAPRGHRRCGGHTRTHTTWGQSSGGAHLRTRSTLADSAHGTRHAEQAAGHACMHGWHGRSGPMCGLHHSQRSMCFPGPRVGSPHMPSTRHAQLHLSWLEVMRAVASLGLVSGRGGIVLLPAGSSAMHSSSAMHHRALPSVPPAGPSHTQAHSPLCHEEPHHPTPGLRSVGRSSLAGRPPVRTCDRTAAPASSTHTLSLAPQAPISRRPIIAAPGPS